MLSAVALAATAHAAEPTTTETQSALSRLRARTHNARVVWPSERATPSLLAGLSEHVDGDRPETRAQAFLSSWSPLIGIAPEQLRVRSVEDTAGRSTVRFQQLHDGLPVDGRTMSITLEGDRVISVASDLAPLLVVDRATIQEEQARALAVQAVHGTGPDAPSVEIATQATRSIAATGAHGVEVFRVFVARKPLVEHLEVLVDAHRGRVIGISDRAVR
jgi:Zn-dependent metalloprotease